MPPEIKSSSAGNVLFGIGSFILGIPLAFFLFLPGFMSDFGPGETWIKRALLMTLMIIIGYGLVGYILGKIKHDLSWKSGFYLALAPLLVAIFGTIKVLLSLSNPAVSKSIALDGLFILLPVVAAIIVAPLSSHFGSRSQKAWGGKTAKIIFAIMTLAAITLIVRFVVGVSVTNARPSQDLTPVVIKKGL